MNVKVKAKGGERAIKIGKGFVRFRDDGDSGYNFTVK